MGTVNLPTALAPAFWDKQKGALGKAPKAPPTKLGDELKSLVKLHGSIEWDAYGDDRLDGVDQVKQRLAEFDQAVKGRIRALTEQVESVEAAAVKFETEARKDKQFPKEPLNAVATIVKAAKEYRAEVQRFVAGARKALEAKADMAARKSRPAPASDRPGPESKAAKLVRTRALEAIRKIKKPAPGAKPVRFVIVQGKTTVATYIGPSVGPTQEKLLKGLIPGDAPFRTFKDPKGELVWEKNTVTFVSDVLPSGLVKKMQLWLKPILKINLKLRVRKTSGEAEESEGEDIPDDLLMADRDDVTDSREAAEDLQKRLAEMQPAIARALAGPAAARIRTLMATITQSAKAGKFDDAESDLDEVETLLEEVDAADDRAAGAQAAAAARAAEGGAEQGAERSADTGEGRAGASSAAMAEWKARRAAAVASLKAVATRIAAAKHPSSTKAIIEIQAVMKNLSAEPSTLGQVDDLQKWLGSDEVVQDVCELAEDIRTPLLGSLKKLRAALSA